MKTAEEWLTSGRFHRRMDDEEALHFIRDIQAETQKEIAEARMEANCWRARAEYAEKMISEIRSVLGEP